MQSIGIVAAREYLHRFVCILPTIQVAVVMRPAKAMPRLNEIPERGDSNEHDHHDAGN
jgi:hypothetical protein